MPYKSYFTTVSIMPMEFCSHPNYFSIKPKRFSAHFIETERYKQPILIMFNNFFFLGGSIYGVMFCRL